MNITAVIALARNLNIGWDNIIKAVNKFSGIPGRIEFIPEAEKLNLQVIVDYAFEPVAMAELYKVVKLLNPRKIIHVFGATGGGRDKKRRATLGEFVGKRADICIITDEDPYDDDPMEIIEEVAAAVEQTGKKVNKSLFKILYRSEAIKKALDMAQADDLVLITGKGSEQAMVIKGELEPWDDRTVARTAIKSKTQKL
jgi:UDP-N-acetylmuramoyl-L-alanyl-D-glutamate--2,6-diaminopimelate ligase